MQVSIYRVSETKNDTAERETARKNVRQTKKEIAKERDTAYTVYIFKKTDREGETAKKRQIERVYVCVRETRAGERARE